MNAIKVLSFVMVGLMLAGGFAGCVGKEKSAELGEYETGAATESQLLAANAEPAGAPVPVFASDSSPFYALIGTPLACRYDGNASVMKPLLVKGTNVSRAITDLTEGTMADMLGGAITLGDKPVKETSLEIAKTSWTGAECAILIGEDQNGYNLGVVVAPIASYLKIPVIVCKGTDAEVAEVLKGLGVKYTIACGNISGYGAVLRVNDADEALALSTSVVQKFGGVKYIAMANPLDTTHYTILESNKSHFEGVVTKNAEGASVPAAASPDSDAFPKHNVTIPEGWDKVIVRFTLKYDLPAEWDEFGDIVQGYLYSVGADGTETMEIYFRSPGGRRDGNQIMADYLVPAFNKGGTVQKWSMQAWIQSPSAIAQGMKYYLDVDLQKVDTMVYPLMPGLSSMAPYLAACRNGVVLAKPDFALQNPTYIGCIGCGEPAYDSNAVDAANLKCAAIHHELNKYLAGLAGMAYSESDQATWTALAGKYYDSPIPVAIVADTNMIPMFYFGSADPTEGNGQATDVIYQDIDVDPEACPSGIADNRMELPLGRVTGWDVQDVSALIARSVFYNDIIDKVQSPLSAGLAWKDTSYSFIGGAIPIEAMLTTQLHMDMIFQQDGGFTPLTTSNAPGGSDAAGATFQQSANYIWGGAHGFYCWYAVGMAGGLVAHVQDQDSVFDCVRVREMKFGPSVHYMVSCVTGRVDGLLPQNALSQAYLHAGEICYIGATRSTYGPIAPSDLIVAQAGNNMGGTIAVAFFTGLCKENKPLGLAFRDAKNVYFEKEGNEMIYGHFVMYGDPAVNPYEPNNA